MQAQQPGSTAAERRSVAAVADSLHDRFAEALSALGDTIDTRSQIALQRREASREIERQIQRAITRAERRSRRVPPNVRRSMSWVMAQRRRIAYELIRALRERGAGKLVADAIAERACERFPRDGIIVTESLGSAKRPREKGESPRQRGTDQRTLGMSPRQRGQSPRDKQRRHAGTLHNTLFEDGELPLASPVTPGFDDVEIVNPSLPIDELAPGWSSLKQSILDDLEPHERARAHRIGREARERIEANVARSNRRPQAQDDRELAQ